MSLIKNGFFLISSMLLSAVNVNSQQTILYKTFDGPNDDLFNSIIQMSDGGFMLGGYSNSYGAGGSDNLVIKIDSLYNEQWASTYGGNDDEFTSLVKSNDGNILLAGRTHSYGLIPIPDSYNPYFIKIDTVGNVLWSKVLSDNKPVYNNSILEKDNGDWLIPGGYDYENDTVGTIRNGQLVCLTNLGNFKWARCYYDTLQLLQITDIQQTWDTGYLMVGEIYNSSNFNDDPFILKTDSNGTVQWAEKIFELGNSGWLIKLQDRNFLSGMGKWNANGDLDFILTKLDSNGILMWSKKYGSSNSGYDFLSRFVELSNGDFISTRGGALIMLDSNGNILWYKNQSGSGLKTAINLNDGSFLTIGSNNIGSFNNKGVLSKSDSTGTSCDPISSNYPVNPINFQTVPISLYDSLLILSEDTGYTITNVFIPQILDCISATGVINDNPGNREISVYPNPFNTVLTLSSKDLSNETTVDMFDLSGRLICKWNSIAYECKIELWVPFICAGTYLLMIKNRNYQTQLLVNKD